MEGVVQSTHKSNAGLDVVLKALHPIHEVHKDVSYADLIVMAGNVAVEEAGGPDLTLCPGRVDAMDGKTLEELTPREYYTDPVVAFKDSAQVRSLVFLPMHKAL
jgi:catalase (peroxidase I)